MCARGGLDLGVGRARPSSSSSSSTSGRDRVGSAWTSVKSGSGTSLELGDRLEQAGVRGDDDRLLALGLGRRDRAAGLAARRAAGWRRRARRCAARGSCRRPTSLVACRTPATDAPVSSSTAATKRKTARTSTPSVADQAADDALEQLADLAAVGARRATGPAARNRQMPPERNGRTAGSTGRSTRIAPIAASAGGTA